jgi:hypothetical protein
LARISTTAAGRRRRRRADTHRALLAAGRLADPYGDGGENACRWVEDREWWWRARFETAASTQRICM